MAFGNIFDGYCVIHAEHAVGERKAWFEKEFKRVGINDFIIVEAPLVLDDEPRAVMFQIKEALRRVESTKRSAAARISLCHARIQCLNLARKNNWKHVVIMEDDVIFHENISDLWVDVEPSVLEFDWEIMYLYEASARNREHEEPPVRLRKSSGTLWTHCYVIRESYYDIYQQAVEGAMRNGYSVDTKNVFKFLNRHQCRIFSTSVTLAKQSMEFKSSIKRRWQAYFNDFLEN